MYFSATCLIMKVWSIVLLFSRPPLELPIVLLLFSFSLSAEHRYKDLTAMASQAYSSLICTLQFVLILVHEYDDGTVPLRW